MRKKFLPGHSVRMHVPSSLASPGQALTKAATSLVSFERQDLFLLWYPSWPHFPVHWDQFSHSVHSYNRRTWVLNINKRKKDAKKAFLAPSSTEVKTENYRDTAGIPKLYRKLKLNHQTRIETSNSCRGRKIKFKALLIVKGSFFDRNTQKTAQ